MANAVKPHLNNWARIIPPMRQRSKIGKHHDSVLAANLRRLIKHEFGGSVNACAERYRFNQSTLNRYVNGDSDATTSALFELLEESRFRPHQLLDPDFDPRGPAAGPRLSHRALEVAMLFDSLGNDERGNDRRSLLYAQAQMMHNPPIPADPSPPGDAPIQAPQRGSEKRA